MKGSSPARRVLAAAAAMLAALGVALALRWWDSAATRLYEKTVTAMGTLVTVALYSPDAAAADAATQAAFDTIGRIEKSISRFDPAGDVSRINSAAPGAPVKVSPDTIACLERSIDLSKRTGGAFDPTVGPLVALWKAAGKSGVLPADADIEAARKAVSWSALTVDRDGCTVTVSRPGVSIDLSSVGKSYAANEAARAMRARGVTAGFVNAGGDIAFIGRNPDGRLWRVGVADPRDEKTVYTALYVADRGVVTSGNYYQFQTIAGRRYSHIIDARTGRPAEGPASVTVVAPTAADGAGWSTALSVLGREGRAAADAAGIDYLMLFVEGGAITRVESAGMARYEKEGGK